MAQNILEKFQPEEIKRLEDAFRESHHPDTLSLRFLAAEIGIPNDEVEKWFEARLSKWRKDEGFIPIAERAAFLTNPQNNSVKNSK
ncbi:homeodomain-only protein-like [Actinia tenebrosa]|uniref:Homeodomain-only protein n=1 Tax=Actinia tenebrosa TaxID=6105 RepID=A0A6P8IJM6_ACTTE|nr:homeodomain-only protein-like [Actinia tenebrosa]